MLFARHSLGFVLLGVLISAACAMPTLERRNDFSPTLPSLGAVHYSIRTFDKDNHPVIVSDKVLGDIVISFQLMPPRQMLDDDKFRQIEYMTPLESPLKPDCKDLSQEPYDPSRMAYYSATGGSLCTGDLKCYGYVVTSHSGIKFGSLINGFDNGRTILKEVFEVHQPLVTQASTEAEALAYYIAFLKNFAPAREWMKQLSLRKDEPYRSPSFAVKSVIKDIKDAERGAAKAAKAGADKDVSTGDKRKRPLQDVGGRTKQSITLTLNQKAIEDHRKV